MSFIKYKIYSKTLNSAITIKAIRQDKLTINQIAEILKIDKKEPELESFEDLKEKKDIVKSFKVDKKEDISDDEVSDEYISDEDISDDEEPKESPSAIKEEPTLF